MNKWFCIFLLLALFGFAMATDTRCFLPIETGPCRAMKIRYGYNPNTNRCEQFVYGGCQGNENNFETEQECNAACN